MINPFMLWKSEINQFDDGQRQKLEMLINKEARLLAKYLRDETDTWRPRTAHPLYSIKHKGKNCE
jgi:nitrogen fixation-related uncharacterized protein